MAIIAHITGASKRLLSRVPTDVLIAIVVILACFLSFGLGMLAGKADKEGEVTITQMPLTEGVPSTLSSQSASAVVSVPETAPQPVMQAGGQYVASKKGTKYHLPWCSGGKAIAEANKIWFATKEDAERAGYTPAANCKGI
jgi:hypothetical protein